MKMTTSEYIAKIDGVNWELEEARIAWLRAQSLHQEQLALIEIDYNGPDWLMTGRCGGWK